MGAHDTRTAVALLWLAGVGARLTVLAVPPVIVFIQRDLDLTGTQIGILSGLPVILFAVAALPGALLISRVGALNTLVIGLAVASVASALRGAAPDIWVLYAGTMLMGAGIAIMQPAAPALVRQWLPERIGMGSALYTNGLLVGESLPVALTVPLVFPLVNDSWRGSLALWGVPLLVFAFVIWRKAPRPQSAGLLGRQRWWPDWADPLTWKLGLTIGSIMSVYFCTNAFLPGHLTAAGRPDLISITLTAFNLFQIPASFVLMAVASRVERRLWPFVVVGIASLLLLAGIVFTASLWTAVFAAMLGFLLAFPFALGLTLPAFLLTPENIGRAAAAMFALGYAWAMLFSVLGGMAWDLAGDPRFAFLPVALSALPLLTLLPTIRMHPVPA